MTDRLRDLDDSRPTRQAPAGPKAKGRGRFARRPAVEALEGRALLSVAGGPDFTYAIGSATFTTGGPGSDTQGLALVNFSASNPNLSSVAIGEAMQSDGKVVVVGYLINLISLSATIDLTRLDTDGSVDTTFGTQGIVALPATVGRDTGEAVAIQPNGDIVAAANVSPGTTLATQQVAVYRLNADGSPDTTFGTGGSVDFTFDQGTTALFSAATTLAIQPDGGIVVGGDGYSTTAGFAPALARLTAAGVPDSAFGTAGQVLPTFVGSTFPKDIVERYSLGVSGLVAQADGSIVFDTTVVPASGSGVRPASIAVGKLTAAGSFDPSFGTGGQVQLGTADIAGGLAVQADGKLVVAGSYYAQVGTADEIATHFDAYRLTTAGTPDATFGAMGEAIPLPSNISAETVSSVLIRPDGSILLGGMSTLDMEGARPTLLALHADGSPDLEFGSGGEEALPSPYYEDAEFPAETTDGLAIQADGKILMETNKGVARLLATGGTDDFNEDGASDPTVILPNFTDPFVVYRPAGSPDVITPFGTEGPGQSLPAPGAYDASGIDEIAVYLPAPGAFGIRPYGTTGPQDEIIYVGQKGLGNSIPAPADYTGAGHTQVGVFEPGPADFVYSTDNTSNPSSDVTVQFGAPGAGNSIPVPADYDGSGHDEVAVYLPATASFAYRPAAGGPDVFAAFGSPGAGNTIPVPADYDGSGHTELGVYLPAIGAFAYRPYGAAAGTPDVVEPFGMPGIGNSVPMPGDYDGSGHVELAVYMPSVDAFAYRPYGGGKDVVISFGEPGSGNTIPFTATGAESIAGGSGGGGGGGAHASAVSAGWVDFVPDVAGPAKKGNAGQATAGGSQGRS